MLGRVVSIGKVQRKLVVVEALSYEFDYRFEEAMAWIDKNIEVLSMSIVERKERRDYSDWIKEKYIVFYRELEREDIEES
ncbi:TPA: hypothetical protein N2D99_002123 [Clostridium botulinum]|nr:hypothetical protein [Clostridium botulinum]